MDARRAAGRSGRSGEHAALVDPRQTRRRTPRLRSASTRRALAGGTVQRRAASATGCGDDRPGEPSRHGSICPSDAARAIGGARWRTVMDEARDVARQLAQDGHLEILHYAPCGSIPQPHGAARSGCARRRDAVGPGGWVARGFNGKLSAMTGVEVLVACGVAVGVIGVVVPIVPGALLVWAAILVWGISVGTAAGWGVVAVAHGVDRRWSGREVHDPGQAPERAGCPSAVAHRRWCRGRRGLLRRTGRRPADRVRARRVRVRAPACRGSDGMAVDEGRSACRSACRCSSS